MSASDRNLRAWSGDDWQLDSQNRWGIAEVSLFDEILSLLTGLSIEISLSSSWLEDNILMRWISVEKKYCLTFSLSFSARQVPLWLSDGGLFRVMRRWDMKADRFIMWSEVRSCCVQSINQSGKGISWTNSLIVAWGRGRGLESDGQLGLCFFRIFVCQNKRKTLKKTKGGNQKLSDLIFIFNNVQWILDYHMIYSTALLIDYLMLFL